MSWYTPGPWKNHGRQPNVGGLPHSAVAAKTLLARVYSEAYGDVVQEKANADLIAAAPDLLEALKASADSFCSYCCPSVWKTGDDQPHSEQCKANRAAIAKAEGEQT